MHAYRTLSHASILVYLAAVRHGHLERGYCDPLVDRPLLTYLCKGIRRHQGSHTTVRQPLTLVLLRGVKSALTHSHSFLPQDKPLLWAAITMGFYGFLHGGEFTMQYSHAYQPARHLLRRDISLSPDHYSILIKGSKTDPFRASSKVMVAATGTATCPVKAMKAFLRVTSHHRTSRPLFTLSTGKYLTRQALTDAIRTLLQATGLTAEQAAQYSSHSLRIGAATEAASAGLPTWLIQMAGRWRSEAYKRYIRTPKRALLNVAPALARGTHT